MSENTHTKNLALERIILFSDAVFAIAITLLVIELKIPEPEEPTNRMLAISLLHTIPHFFSFVLSFIIIAIYWIAHHRMFTYVINYDNRLIWLNLLLLLFIALMPFSSSVYGLYGHLNNAFYLYVLNISCVAFFNYRIYNHLARHEKKLSKGLENKQLVNYYKWRAWIVPLCFLLGVICTLILDGNISIMISRFSPALIFPAMIYLKKHYAPHIAERD